MTATLPQLTAFGLLAGMMLLFVWGRMRYDMVAVVALLAALLLGLVKPEDAFGGFADDIVIIVGSALVISAAVERSGVIEAAIGRLSGGMTRMGSQLSLLVGSVTLLSAMVKNIGARSPC